MALCVNGRRLRGAIFADGVHLHITALDIMRIFIIKFIELHKMEQAQ
ncbi:hypothetical protein [Arsenophonus apicola]